jgi:hypothetical protein
LKRCSRDSERSSASGRGVFAFQPGALLLGVEELAQAFDLDGDMVETHQTGLFRISHKPVSTDSLSPGYRSPAPRMPIKRVERVINRAGAVANLHKCSQ